MVTTYTSRYFVHKHPPSLPVSCLVPQSPSPSPSASPPSSSSSSAAWAARGGGDPPASVVTVSPAVAARTFRARSQVAPSASPACHRATEGGRNTRAHIRILLSVHVIRRDVDRRTHRDVRATCPATPRPARLRYKFTAILAGGFLFIFILFLFYFFCSSKVTQSAARASLLLTTRFVYECLTMTINQHTRSRLFPLSL